MSKNKTPSNLLKITAFLPVFSASLGYIGYSSAKNIGANDWLAQPIGEKSGYLVFFLFNLPQIRPQCERAFDRQVLTHRAQLACNLALVGGAAW